MSDTTDTGAMPDQNTPAGETPAESTPVPTPKDVAPDSVKQSGDTEGKGSKDAVLADLAKERDARQEAQKELEELKSFREGITKLLGGGDDDNTDPIELAKRETERANSAERMLEVYRAAPVGTDIPALADSKSFESGLTQATDVKEYVEQFLRDNPRYRPGDSNVARNLNSGNFKTPPSQSFDDMIRASAAGR